MQRAFDERWIDYSDNVGKSTGAFCASPYDAHPFILISYQASMRSAFTLAHELGHLADAWYPLRQPWLQKYLKKDNLLLIVGFQC